MRVTSGLAIQRLIEAVSLFRVCRGRAVCGRGVPSSLTDREQAAEETCHKGVAFKSLSRCAGRGVSIQVELYRQV